MLRSESLTLERPGEEKANPERVSSYLPCFCIIIPAVSIPWDAWKVGNEGAARVVDRSSIRAGTARDGPPPA